MHQECESIVNSIIHIRTRWELSQPDSIPQHTKIRPKDVPGTLLNIALLNLGSSDPSLRSAAYNLLCALTCTFNLKIEGQLLETSGLCIPANNTLFIVSISKTLAANEPHLTLEFLEECISGFSKSSIELKHLCLEYMTPWLLNLVRFCKHSDDGKRQRVTAILDKLITMTINEKQMYPSIQAKIWGSLGQITDLLDVVLDSFIKTSATGGLGSIKAEVMADTAVALASGNVKLVSSKVIIRMCKIIDKTCLSPTPTLEQHLMWDDIAILARYMLMLSFNNSLDVAAHLPYLFHVVTLLVATGPLSLRASTHGLVINIIHSLCTCSQLCFSEETKQVLRLSLTEFSLPKFYLLFGISKVKSAAVIAFRSSYRDRSFSPGSYERETFALSSLETVTEALLEIMEPRALVVFGCISKRVTHTQMKQIIRILSKASPLLSIDRGLESCLKSPDNCNSQVLIEATVIALTKLQPLLNKDSPMHKALFWVAVAVLQLDEVNLYSAGTALLEQNLHTLDSLRVFNDKSPEEVFMEIRQPLEWHCKQMDHFVGLNFNSNFNFALVGHLLKGFRHPSPTTVARTIRILHMLLALVGKHLNCDKFEVNTQSVAYLAGKETTAFSPFLLSSLHVVSEEVRSRCSLKHRKLLLSDVTMENVSMDTYSGHHEDPTCRLLRESQLWTSPKVSERYLMAQYPIVGQVSPRTRKSMSLDMGQPSQVNTKKLLGTRKSFDHLISDSKAPKRPEMESGITTPPKMRRVAENEYEIETPRISHHHLRKVSVSESNVLLNEEVLTDPKIQALLLTVLATQVKNTSDEFEQRVLYEFLAEASVVFPKVFPVVHNLLDSKINTLLSLCQDPNLLNPVHGIVQSVVYHEESPPQYQTSYLQTFGFNGLWRFAGPFSKQTQFPDYAELIVKFLDGLIDTYLPGIDEETSEEGLRTPTSPYPPPAQSQLSITANLNLSNSMTSLATSQHAPGIDKEKVDLSPTTGLASSGRTRHGSASQVQKQRSTGSFKRPSIKKIHLVGRLIGKQGKFVNFLKQSSGAKIYVSTLPFTQEIQICHIHGSQQQVDDALSLIRKKFKDLDLSNCIPLPCLPITSWLLLPQDVFVEVIVSQMEAGLHLFVQQHKHPSYLALPTLIQHMQLCYSQPGCPSLPTPVEVGVVCAAPVTGGGWQRAQVIQYCIESGMAHIRYVDNGGYDTVNSATLRQIRSDFVTLPFQAAEVLLDNITPLPGEEFSLEARAALDELTANMALIIKVTGSQDGLPLVHMWKQMGDEVVLLNRLLAEQGFCTWFETQ
ncbi:hypothetical protein PO909_022796 [Leuciscus waleckii]